MEETRDNHLLRTPLVELHDVALVRKEQHIKIQVQGVPDTALETPLDIEAIGSLNKRYAVLCGRGLDDVDILWAQLLDHVSREVNA